MLNQLEPDIPRESRFDVIDPLTSADWDQFVSQRAEATPFHTSAWARLLSETYGFQLAYVVERNRGRIVAGLPLAETGGRIRPRRGIGLPFSDFCGVLGIAEPAGLPDADAGARTVPNPSNPLGHPLLQCALDHAARRKWRAIELRDSGATPGSSGSSVEFWGHRLDLTGGLAAVEARRSDSVARSARKAAKSGLLLKIGSEATAMRDYFRLHCLTRKRHGQPPQPWSFFEGLQRHLVARGLGCVILALQGEEPIAGAVLLHQGGEAVYKFGASDEAHQALRPNNLVFNGMITHCVQMGCTNLDFGRTSLGNDGLRRFKLGWGCSERRIRYQRFRLPSVSLELVEDRAASWHTKVFRLLPLPIAALVGRIAYRFAT